MKTCPAGGNAFPRENPKHWKGVTAEDIPQGWMDDMVKRLFEILNRQMIRVEQAQIAESDKNPMPADERQRVSREMIDLQRSLDRLTNMEVRRVAVRDTKAKLDDEDPHARLERRINAVLDALATQGVPGKSDG